MYKISNYSSITATGGNDGGGYPAFFLSAASPRSALYWHLIHRQVQVRIQILKRVSCYVLYKSISDRCQRVQKNRAEQYALPSFLITEHSHAQPPITSRAFCQLTNRFANIFHSYYLPHLIL